jgi:septum formation inhibitor-activating ATPase MinD
MEIQLEQPIEIIKQQEIKETLESVNIQRIVIIPDKRVVAHLKDLGAFVVWNEQEISDAEWSYEGVLERITSLVSDGSFISRKV